MAQRFIICTESGSTETAITAKERNRITKALEAKGWQVWHWLEDLWLAVNPGEKSSAIELRNEIQDFLKAGRYIIVLEVDPIDFAGYAPARGWPWVRKKWTPPK